MYVKCLPVAILLNDLLREKVMRRCQDDAVKKERWNLNKHELPEDGGESYKEGIRV